MLKACITRQDLRPGGFGMIGFDNLSGFITFFPGPLSPSSDYKHQCEPFKVINFVPLKIVNCQFRVNPSPVPVIKLVHKDEAHIPPPSLPPSLSPQIIVVGTQFCNSL